MIKNKGVEQNMIEIENLPQQEQETILREIRQWEKENHQNEITEEELERMAQEQLIIEMKYGYCEPMDEQELLKMKKEGS